MELSVGYEALVFVGFGEGGYWVLVGEVVDYFYFLDGVALGVRYGFVLVLFLGF